MKKLKIFLSVVLCFLMLTTCVVFSGCGIVDAWYRARAQETGTVKLDKGIILTVTDINQTNNNISAQVTGNLCMLNNAKNDIISFPSEISSTKNVVIPSISAGSESNSFYAKAKLVYTFQKYNENRTINETIYNAEDLFMDNTGTTNILDASNGIFSNLLQFNNKWDQTSMANDYYLYIGASGTAGTPVAINDGDEPVYLFTDENVENTLEKKIDVLEFNNFSNYEEQFGGPKIYLRSGNSGNYNYTQVEIAKFDVKVVIDVIQSENLTAEALVAWKAAA